MVMERAVNNKRGVPALAGPSPRLSWRRQVGLRHFGRDFTASTEILGAERPEMHRCTGQRFLVLFGLIWCCLAQFGLKKTFALSPLRTWIPDGQGSLKSQAFISTSLALLAFLILFPLSTLSAPPWRSVQPIGTGKTGFSPLPSSETGIQFSNVLSDAAVVKNQILLLGSGVALGDVDGDGWCDIYFCRLEGPNVLYRNLGNWKFEDITAQAGVACRDQYSTGAAFADVDGDGDLDLLVNSLGGGTRLVLNDGKAQFTEATDAVYIRQIVG